jgi:flagellar hook assembly protein FlgD
LPTESEATVVVFDIAGRVVRTLAGGMQAAGESNLIWDLADNFGHPVGAGMYLMQARLADRTFVKRLVVTR